MLFALLALVTAAPLSNFPVADPSLTNSLSKRSPQVVPANKPTKPPVVDAPRGSTGAPGRPSSPVRMTTPPSPVRPVNPPGPVRPPTPPNPVRKVPVQSVNTPGPVRPKFKSCKSTIRPVPY